MQDNFPRPAMVASNGIRLAVHEAGSGPPVVLLHGFPELAYSWRHQLPALAAAGYRAIAPDLRGYGGSDKPPTVGDYRMELLLADITGLLEALALERAVFVGHDWGALLLWQLALLRPDVMRGLVALNIPFMPRSARDPVDMMRARFGDNYYIVNFQDSDEADRRFAADPARFINTMMRRGQITRAAYDQLPAARKVIDLLAALDRDAPGGESLLNAGELAYYAAAFAAGGFTAPINWYRNWSANWAAAAGLPQHVSLPTLFLGRLRTTWSSHRSRSRPCGRMSMTWKFT